MKRCGESDPLAQETQRVNEVVRIVALDDDRKPGDWMRELQSYRV